MKSKYGPGGEFDPEWRPPASGASGPGGPGGPPPQDPPGPPPPGSQQPDLPPIAKPAWRSVPKKKDKKAKKAEKQQQQAAAQQLHDLPGMPGPSYAHMQDPRRQIQSWATWQREFCFLQELPLFRGLITFAILLQPIPPYTPHHLQWNQLYSFLIVEALDCSDLARNLTLCRTSSFPDAKSASSKKKTSWPVSR